MLQKLSKFESNNTCNNNKFSCLQLFKQKLLCCNTNNLSQWFKSFKTRLGKLCTKPANALQSLKCANCKKVNPRLPQIIIKDDNCHCQFQIKISIDLEVLNLKLVLKHHALASLQSIKEQPQT